MIRQAVSTDAYIIAQLAIKMWTSHTADELLPEFNSLIACDDAVIYICTVDEKVIGFGDCESNRLFHYSRKKLESKACWKPGGKACEKDISV